MTQRQLPVAVAPRRRQPRCCGPPSALVQTRHDTGCARLQRPCCGVLVSGESRGRRIRGGPRSPQRRDHVSPGRVPTLMLAHALIRDVADTRLRKAARMACPVLEGTVKRPGINGPSNDHKRRSMQRHNAQRSTGNGPPNKIAIPNDTGMLGVSVISNGHCTFSVDPHFYSTSLAPTLLFAVTHQAAAACRCHGTLAAQYSTEAATEPLNRFPVCNMVSARSHCSEIGESFTITGYVFYTNDNADALFPSRHIPHKYFWREQVRLAGRRKWRFEVPQVPPKVKWNQMWRHRRHQSSQQSATHPLTASPFRTPAFVALDTRPGATERSPARGVGRARARDGVAHVWPAWEKTALPASGPRPVRVRSFEFYRAPRVRSASGPRPLPFPPGPTWHCLWADTPIANSWKVERPEPRRGFGRGQTRGRTGHCGRPDDDVLAKLRDVFFVQIGTVQVGMVASSAGGAFPGGTSSSQHGYTSFGAGLSEYNIGTRQYVTRARCFGCSGRASLAEGRLQEGVPRQARAKQALVWGWLLLPKQTSGGGLALPLSLALSL
eukprot:gene17060-biopygen6813